jgi:hypothetical protein
MGDNEKALEFLKNQKQSIMQILKFGCTLAMFLKKQGKETGSNRCLGKGLNCDPSNSDLLERIKKNKS